jgi:hypothetical protein
VATKPSPFFSKNPNTLISYDTLSIYPFYPTIKPTKPSSILPQANNRLAGIQQNLKPTAQKSDA